MEYQVRYENVRGTHIFWSTDPDAAGLCVASGDLEKAYAEVTLQLGHLLKGPAHEKIPVEPAASLEEFVATVAKLGEATWQTPLLSVA